MLNYKQRLEEFKHVRSNLGSFKVLTWGRQQMNTYQIVYRKASSVQHFGYHREIEGLIDASSVENAKGTARDLLEHTARYKEMIADGFELVAQGALTPIDIVLRIKSGANFIMREMQDHE